MIEQESVHGSVPSTGESLLEAPQVQTRYTGLAFESAAHETDLAVLGEQIYRLVVQALVDVVAIGMLQAADRVRVLEDAHVVLQLFDGFLQDPQFIGCAHSEVS